MANEVEIVIKAVDQASGTLEKVGSALGGLGEIALGIAAAGLTAVAAGMGVLITKGAEAQDVQAMFNSVLSQSPLKDYGKQLEDLALSYSKVTRFEEDNIVSAETVLLRYQNLGQDVMPLAIKTTLNLATVMKTDATSAAQSLGKALEDIAGGSLSLLARTRLLTKEQKDQAEAMAKAGDAAGAQSFILDILDKKIGAVATDMGQTFAGRMEIFRNTLSRIAEDAGMKLLPVLEPLITRLTDLAMKVAPSLVAGISAIVPYIAAFVDWLLRLNTFTIPAPMMMMWEAILKGVSAVWQSIQIDLVPALQMIVFWFQNNQPQVEAFVQRMAWLFSNVLVPIVTAAIIATIFIISSLITVVMFLSNTMSAVANGVNAAFRQIASVATAAFNQVMRVINAAIDVISNLIAAIRSIPEIHLGSLSGSNTRQTGPGQRASGGPVAAGEAYIVGEQGPELLMMGNRAGNIVPNGVGGNIVFNFPNYIGTPQDLKNAMQQAVRQMQLDGRLKA